jgi:DNA-binding response OmpR family regulator
MPPDHDSNFRDLIVGGVNDLWEVEGDGAQNQSELIESVFVRPPSSYRHAFGDKPIRLGMVEFRILLFLASRPYHAFTHRQIADAATTETVAVSKDAVDGHITALRDQLGVLHDFVQTVPHVGYRYKA